MDSATTKHQCTTEQHNGIGSIAITDHKRSSSSSSSSLSSSENHRNGSRSISRPLYSFPPPRSGTFVNGRFQEQQSHFLDSCHLCKKPLGFNRDIFMYRGDLPFCSVECRSEQIEIDETKQKNRSLKASIKALRKKEEREKSSTSSPSYPFDSGAVIAA